MADLFENPMGLDGFEFVEFASPEPGILEPVFELLGFSAVAKHRSKNYIFSNISQILGKIFCRHSTNVLCLLG